MTSESPIYKKTGIALRTSLFLPGEIVGLAKVIDQSSITHLFLNESPRGFDSIEICTASLGVSKGILVGTGVIRLYEHDEKQLLKRLKTIQSLSHNRFVLGIGTGSPGANPAESISTMLKQLRGLRDNFPKEEESTIFPQTFIATLRDGIARKVAGSSDGILMNFCSPEYAEKLIHGFRESFKGETDFACYLKVFYSKTMEAAEGLLLDEFVKYDAIKQYHQMFESAGIMADIKGVFDSGKRRIEVPYSLLRVSLANPSSSELKQYVAGFREAGVTIPFVYPYFAQDGDHDFRLEKIQSIISSIT